MGSDEIFPRPYKYRVDACGCGCYYYKRRDKTIECPDCGIVPDSMPSTHLPEDDFIRLVISDSERGMQWEQVIPPVRD